MPHWTKYNTNKITFEEIIFVIENAKRSKAPGPDEIPIEFYKELGGNQKLQLLELLNDWWQNENMPKEVLRARVVLIFKKGDSTDLANYRPTSLLNSIYKIFAAILQKRISNIIDPFL